MDAAATIAKYQPADGRDCNAEAYAARLQICERCEHRDRTVCRLDGRICSVRARRRDSVCHAHLWPDSITPAGLTEHTPIPLVVADAGPKPIRVVMLTPNLNSGGAETWLWMLAQYMSAVSRDGRPVEVIACVCTSVDTMGPTMVQTMGRWTRVIKWTDLDVDPAHRELLATADVFLCWGIGPLRQFVKPFPQAKILWVCHGSTEWTSQLIVGRDGAEGARAVATHWGAVSEKSKSIFPADLRDQVRVISNGVDPSRCVPALGRDAVRKSWGLTNDQIAVGYVGRFSPEKRPEAVAEAIVHLPGTYVGIMVGSGWKDKETRAKVRGIAGDRVRFVGHSDHVGDAYSGLDYWVNASPAEGDCLGLKEAALARVPIISTPTGAIPDLEATHGQFTELVSVGCSGQTIARAIEFLEANPSERTRRADLGQKMVWEHYNAQRMAAGWVAFLRDILSPAAEAPTVPETITNPFHFEMAIGANLGAA